jgi:hypothetical protein
LAVFLVLFGNYLLVNVMFHYAMAYTRGPGTPPTDGDETTLTQVNK